MSDNIDYIITINGDEDFVFNILDYLVDDKDDVAEDPQWALDSFVEAWNDEAAGDEGAEVIEYATLYRVEDGSRTALATY